MTYDRLQQWFYKTVQAVPTEFKRYLWHQINWESRFIIITGARGVGKTTMILQYIKEQLPINEETLYVRMDDLYFNRYSLVEFAEEFASYNGKFLFLDEIHKYPGWSREVKIIYDQFPELKLVLTGSSTTEISKGEGDLSRRALFYHLPGLSFREYMAFENKLKYNPVTLDDLIHNSLEMTLDITEKIHPLPLFHDYLKTGYYPFYKEDPEGFHKRLNQIINTTLDTDIPASLLLDYRAIFNMRKLLGLITEMVPFKPNITKLSQQIGLSRESLIKYLQYLKKADLIELLFSSRKGVSRLNKPEKIYLNNTSIIFALYPTQPNIGNLRETFFINQLHVNHTVSYPEKGDFWVDNTYLFEVGGKSKTGDQIVHTDNAWIAADNIEIAVGKKMPLWLFGFLY